METTTPKQKSAAALALAAVGVVFGDIGTSPLYAIKESFGGAHPLAPDEPHVLGVLSLIFWAIMLVVTTKYVALMMRADNKGEGGSLALLALASRLTHGSNLTPIVIILGIFAAALFYGDSMITPAISVLSAVEGLQVAAPALEPYVVPLTLAILIALFALQKHGTARVGALFGPITMVWFAVLAVIGLIQIVEHPVVLWALNPYYAVNFFMLDGWIAFLALGSVVLVVTGSEALYTDMGHFGRFPIRLAWFGVVLPALVINYFGQGALILGDARTLDNPLFRMVPDWAALPMVGLATAATIIASQAVITGAFSVTRQAIQLGYLPRMQIIHTSAAEMGQIYLPFVNWMLAFFVALLVLGFQSSTHLAAAYGIAVTGTMIIDALLLAIVAALLWRWKPIVLVLVIGLFLFVDLSFFTANLTKLTHGGWFPLAVGLVIFLVLTTWKRGRALLWERVSKDALELDTFLKAVSDRVPRVPGTAIFMTGTATGTPGSLLHNLKHNKVLHEQVVVLTVRFEEIPYVPEDQRFELTVLPKNFYRLRLRYGFMEGPNIPDALRKAEGKGLHCDPMQSSYFLSRETVIPSTKPGMAMWREHLFAWMSRSATSAMDFFNIPPNRVVELGTQIEI
ncbi:potassium transporter Kup [Dongia deserti]|uniref:potassium transporter Kup n=1 Tax=Dongia deserti TaxID=2268030 RepID=UPI000E65D114|nr:potassium transporter Kup [Dongia deserti]